MAGKPTVAAAAPFGPFQNRFEIRLPPGEYHIQILSAGSGERVLAGGAATVVEDGETTIELRAAR